MGKTINVLLISFVPLELEGAGTSRLLNLLVDFLSKNLTLNLKIEPLVPRRNTDDLAHGNIMLSRVFR